jgi:hypothetical protein
MYVCGYDISLVHGMEILAIFPPNILAGASANERSANAGHHNTCATCTQLYFTNPFDFWRYVHDDDMIDGNVIKFNGAWGNSCDESTEWIQVLVVVDYGRELIESCVNSNSSVQCSFQCNAQGRAKGLNWTELKICEPCFGTLGSLQYRRILCNPLWRKRNWKAQSDHIIVVL